MPQYTFSELPGAVRCETRCFLPNELEVVSSLAQCSLTRGWLRRSHPHILRRERCFSLESVEFMSGGVKDGTRP